MSDDDRRQRTLARPVALVHSADRPSLDVKDEMLTLAALAGLELSRLAGFALVAWNDDGVPMVYPGLDSPINPVLPPLLPAYVQAALQAWLDDWRRAPDDFCA